jgi:hypothetical protein
MSRSSREESEDFNTKEGEEERREPTKNETQGWGRYKGVGRGGRLGSLEMRHE